MTMNESRVLRSSASPKNVSPHMNGGSAHTQLSGQKPIVRVNMNNGGVQAHNKPGNNVVLKSGAGPRRVTPTPNVGPQGATVQTGRAGAQMPPGGPKPMVHVNMATGGKPQVSTDGRPLPPGNVQLLGRNGDRRPASAAARRPVPQPQSGGFRAIAAPVMTAAPVVSSKQLSDEQLMLCRYVLGQYTKSEDANELTAALAAKTLEDIDTLLKGGAIESVDSTETVLENEGEVFESTADAPAQLNISVGPAQRSGGGVRGPRRFAASRVIPPPTELDGMGGDEPVDIPMGGQQIIDVGPSDGSPE